MAYKIHVRDLAASLLAQGHTPTVLTGGGGPFVDVLRATGIPVVILRHLTVPIRPIRDLRALREIRAALKEMRPELIAVHSSKAGILGRLAGRSLEIPVLLTAHGWDFTPGISPVPAAVYRQIERSAGPLATRIITVSEFDRQLGAGGPYRQRRPHRDSAQRHSRHTAPVDEPSRTGHRFV